jgi:hypothetical protein
MVLFQMLVCSEYKLAKPLSDCHLRISIHMLSTFILDNNRVTSKFYIQPLTNKMLSLYNLKKSKKVVSFNFKQFQIYG